MVKRSDFPAGDDGIKEYNKALRAKSPKYKSPAAVESERERRKAVGYSTLKRRTAEKKAGRVKPDRCEVCNKSGVICFDHCHSTGKFRGWLCKECNVVLGIVKEDPETLRKLAAYLDTGGTVW